MNRRDLLSSAAVVSIGAASGCLGYTVKETEEVSSLQNKVDSQNQTIGELKSQNNLQNLTIQKLRENNTALSEKLSEANADTYTARAKRILYLYGYAITIYNEGTDFYNAAYSNIQNSNYSAARANFNAAGGYFDSAAVDFHGARVAADELDEDSVVSDCSDANSRADGLYNAMGAYQKMAYYYEDGERSRAQSYGTKGDSYYNTATSYPIADRSSLEEELGVTINSDTFN